MFLKFVEVCPPIERVCNEGALLVGEYGPVFRTACHMHEMCLICVSIDFLLLCFYSCCVVILCKKQVSYRFLVTFIIYVVIR